MPEITGTALIGDAFALLNVFLPGESIPAADANFALRSLNRMLDAWRQQALLIPLVARERFDLDGVTGGPTDPYTIGPGGDFDTDRPANQNSIVSANLVLTATSPEVRVPLGIYTTTAYDANQLPSMTSSQPTGLYYNPTYEDDLGSIFLWPVPNTATNDLELFLQKPIAQLADLSTGYWLPNGYEDALVYNLARRLAGPYGHPLSDEDTNMAWSSLGVIERANTQIFDLANDVAFSSFRTGVYNIQTGANG